MAWTYTAGAATNKDRIRLRIGDTISSAPTDEQLADEEIADLVTTEGSFLPAAAAAARALAAKILRKATEKQIGNLRLVYQARYQALLDIAKQLDTAVSSGAMPYVGGVSISDRQTIESNTDRVAPGFTTGMLNNPRAS